MKNLPVKKSDFTHSRPIDNAVAETVTGAAKASDQVLGRFTDVAMIAASWFFELDAKLRISFYSCDVHLPSGRQSSELMGTSELELCKSWSDKSESLLRYLELIRAHKPFDMEIELIDEQGQPVLPGVFMPTPERYNLATQLDTWVVNASFKWLTSVDNVRCSINLSAMSIVNEEFLQFILATLEASKVDPGRVCF